MPMNAAAVISDALENSLSSDELSLLLHKINPEETKERSYQQVARDMDMSVREAKKRYSNIVATLNADRGLQAYGHIGLSRSDPKVHLVSKDSSEVDIMMAETLSQINLHRSEFDEQDNPNTTNMDKPAVANAF